MRSSEGTCWVWNFNAEDRGKKVTQLDQQS